MYPYMPIEFQNWMNLLITAFGSAYSGWRFASLLISVCICIAAFNKVVDYYL